MVGASEMFLLQCPYLLLLIYIYKSRGAYITGIGLNTRINSEEKRVFKRQLLMFSQAVGNGF